MLLNLFPQENSVAKILPSLSFLGWNWGGNATNYMLFCPTSNFCPQCAILSSVMYSLLVLHFLVFQTKRQHWKKTALEILSQKSSSEGTRRHSPLSEPFRVSVVACSALSRRCRTAEGNSVCMLYKNDNWLWTPKIHQGVAYIGFFAPISFPFY